MAIDSYSIKPEAFNLSVDDTLGRCVLSNSYLNSLQTDPTPKSTMIQGKEVEHVPVQKSALDRLAFELTSIHFEPQKFDWVTLLVGSASATTISWFVELFGKGPNLTIYSVICVVLWIAAYIAKEVTKSKDSTVRNKVIHEHALLALKDIYKAANLLFPNNTHNQ